MGGSGIGIKIPASTIDALRTLYKNDKIAIVSATQIERMSNPDTKEATDYFEIYLGALLPQVPINQQKIIYKLFIEWKMFSDAASDREEETKQKYSNLHNLLKALKENLTRKEEKKEVLTGSEFEILIC